MPNKTETDDYKKWLTQGTTNRALIDTLQINHPGTENIRIVNWDRDVRCVIETGASLKFTAIPFLLDPASVDDSTHQTSALMVSACDGLVYEALKQIPIYANGTRDRTVPITVTHRAYFHDDLTKQVISPPPVWYVTNASPGFEFVRLELGTKPLRVTKTGIYYTQREFPILKYIT
jgi:hypothetical protein